MEKNVKDKFKNRIYIAYLLFLFRNIIIFSSGHSGYTTRIMILSNLVICVALSLIIALKTKKFNIYWVTMIIGISIFGMKYSGFNDMNKFWNIVIMYVYVIFSAFQLILLSITRYLKQKSLKRLIKVILCFFSCYFFSEFYNQHYCEPKSIIYSTEISNIKNEKEMLEIIHKMPMVKRIYYKENKKEIIYPKSDYFPFNFGFIPDNENKNIIMISLSTYINYESMDSLAEKVNGYLTLVNKSNEKIYLYMVTDKSTDSILSEYELENKNIKKVHKLKDLRETDNMLELFFYLPASLIKGESDYDGNDE